MTMTVSDFQQDVRGWLNRLPPGEPMILTENGLPVATITVQAAAVKELRPIGLCAGEIKIADDFNAPLPEAILQDFYH